MSCINRAYMFNLTTTNRRDICDYYRVVILLLGIRRLSGTTGSYWDIYAWQDPHTEDLTDPDI